MKHSIFALEVCLRLPPGGQLRDELKELVVWHPASTTPGSKWQQLRGLTTRLIEHADLFEMGCWDFFDADAKALADYDMWCQGMITEEGARTEPSGEPTRHDVRYMTFTISLLLVAGTQCERDLSRLCDIPEPDLWKKETFLRILDGLMQVNFAAVKSDVLYLIPGNESWGLTAEDLKLPKFEYLRQIQ